MLFGDEFGVNLKNMQCACYAGLLGKATRYLPVWRTYLGAWFNYELTWTPNEDGYPRHLSTFPNNLYIDI